MHTYLEKYKGQSTFEFLMTYGWVIIIVVVVMFGFYALFFLKPQEIQYQEEYNACLQLVDYFDGELDNFNVDLIGSFICSINISDCKRIGNQTMCMNTTLRYKGSINA